MKALIVDAQSRSRLKAAHPTCIFHPGVYVDQQSVLGRYNVIFPNTLILNSTIGHHTIVQKNSRVFHADVGKFCSIAARVSIGLGRHPTDRVSSHPTFYSRTHELARTFSRADDYPHFTRIRIGHDVWIAENAMIMDGVRIGNGAVVAMGAVVTMNVPDYAIVEGNPSRVTGSRFDASMIRRLMASQWWDRPDEWLHEHSGMFNDPERLLAVIEAGNTEKAP